MATIHQNSNFAPVDAAKKLNKAMKGVGTNEGEIIEVLTQHTANQRVAISEAYEQKFGKSLKAELKSELKGQFEKAALQMLHRIPMYLAQELRGAMKGPGTDDEDLIEILFSKTNAELEEIKACYEREYSRQLIVDVAKETSGDFRKLLVDQVKADRDETDRANVIQAKADAVKLFQAGEKKWGTDESVFTEILCGRSFAQLRKVFEEYNSVSGHEIEVAILKETSGNLQKGYLAIVSYVKDSAGYFANRLNKAIRGAGTDDDALVRILISRSEIDLAKVSKKHEEKFKKNLSSAIRSECKGNYQNLLLAIVAGN